MTGMLALYIFTLAAFTGYEVISRVPVILHTPLMSGSNFVHGIVLVGAMVALGSAHTPLEKVIGVLGVLLAAGNAVGGYVVTERMLEMFKASGARRGEGRTDAGVGCSADLAIQASYFITAVLFIMGLKRMSSPVTARSGILWAGAGMAVATLVTFLYPGMSNYELIIPAMLVGGILAAWSGRRVAMTDMPQMIALYNGMGGGAAAAIAAVELYRRARTAGLRQHRAGGGGRHHRRDLLQRQRHRLRETAGPDHAQHPLRRPAAAQPAAARRSARARRAGGRAPELFRLAVTSFFVLALILGLAMTLPIGGADMPVVISLYNALTGLAVALEGFVLDNAAMIIAGTVVGSAGTLLTQLMAKAMNRSLGNVLFSGFGDTGGAATGEVSGSLKPIEASDAGVMMAFANKVIIVPGYGMAVAQAQHKIWELTELLIDRGVTVKFAIHPVAGRMPGHMNVLLAEAGVPYDLHRRSLCEFNPEFETADVALIIGANDVVNPVARTDKSSPIYGMPILNADKAKNVIVIKRGKGAGFSGIENALFYLDNTRMLYGDAQKAVAELITAIKAV